MTSSKLKAALVPLALAATGPAMATPCPTLLSHTVSDITGAPQNLCEHAGKVVLVVNTASQCGYTPQYKGLQALHERYKAKGLVILGFPSNDFGKQEPGTNAEIADFCQRNFAVKFEMFGKTSVAPGVSPLFDGLARATGQRPKWNFHKFVIGRDGRTVASFPSDVEPDSPRFIAKVEEMLKP